MMNEKIQEIEEIIKKYLPKEEGEQKTVIEAMNYSILAGGKRLRPMLMLETYRMFGGVEEVIEPFMAALEMIHTYSLIHDDLPAMDNDDYRRGRKTTHIVYGEAMAILAGDGLLNLAYETAAEGLDKTEYKDRAVRALQVLSRKAGIYGMIGGQTADIEAEENKNVTKLQLLYIHANKTAALIQAALMVGGILAGADEKKIEHLEKIGYNVGIAFQIQDDILDVTSSLDVLGKAVGSDDKNEKATYVTLTGLEESMKEQKALSLEAVELLSSFPEDNASLGEIIKDLVTREK